MDLHNNIKASRALSPVAAVTNDTAFVSQILDCQGFDANELILQAGSLADADATFTLLMEEGDEAALGDNSAVADADLLGTEAGGSFTFANDDDTIKIGYKGSKRYIRATITPANNTGNVFLAGVWLQAGARKPPFTSQIVSG